MMQVRFSLAVQGMLTPVRLLTHSIISLGICGDSTSSTEAALLHGPVLRTLQVQVTACSYTSREAFSTRSQGQSFPREQLLEKP